MKTFLQFFITIGILFGSMETLKSQSYYYTSDSPAYHFMDRVDIQNAQLEFHSALRKYTRKEVAQFVDSLASKNLNSGLTYRFLFKDNLWLHQDNERANNISKSEKVGYESTGLFYAVESSDNTSTENTSLEKRKPFLKHFYKSEAYMFEVHNNDLNLMINPVLNFQIGKDSGNDDLIFQNSRGIELQGDIDDKLYFFSSLYETQSNFNDYHTQRIQKFRSIPGNGPYKNYDSSISDKISGFDFLNAKAYLGFNVSKSVSLELGHDNHFIGNGYRSLLMSDYSHNYFYFKFLVNVWKFNYQSIFAELTAVPSKFVSGNELLPKKYMSSHYLSFKPGRNMEIGLFETIVFSRADHFELQYLNPVILYRTVEQFIGSPDNALLGLNFKYNFLNKYSFYHQTILDEFKLSEITSSNGWWANKFGFQFGLKAIDVANVKNLDLQIEYNVVRPYTYAHRDTLPVNESFNVASYGHYAQPLAHPLGSNFKELNFLINYQASKKILLKGRVMKTMYGEDINDANYGGNIFLPTDTRISDFGNEIGQGETVNVSLLGLDASYMFFHNFYLDVRYLYRKQSSDFQDYNFDTNYFSFGVRINTSNRNIDY